MVNSSKTRCVFNFRPPENCPRCKAEKKFDVKIKRSVFFVQGLVEIRDSLIGSWVKFPGNVQCNVGMLDIPSRITGSIELGDMISPPSLGETAPGQIKILSSLVQYILTPKAATVLPKKRPEIVYMYVYRYIYIYIHMHMHIYIHICINGIYKHHIA